MNDKLKKVVTLLANRKMLAVFQAAAALMAFAQAITVLKRDESNHDHDDES